MPETGENVAEEFQISRADQDKFAYNSQQRAKKAQDSGFFAREITPVTIKGRKGDTVVEHDEHPRPDTTLEMLAKLKTPFRDPGTVTAGNASGVNDGAAALILASEEGAKRHGLTPRARVVAMATAGVPPRIMGIGPAPAVQKLLAKTGLAIGDVDIIELNEAFASQGIAVLRQLGLSEDCRSREPAWWRHRPRPSAGHVRCPSRPDRGQRDGDAWSEASHRHDVHRGRPGHRRADRTGLTARNTAQPRPDPAVSLVGEAIARGSGIPVPGPVIGLVLCVVLLLARDKIGVRLPPELRDGTFERTGQGILSHLSLLFVPAGVGIVQRLDVLAANALAIVSALVVSTVLTLVVTAWVFSVVARHAK